MSRRLLLVLPLLIGALGVGPVAAGAELRAKSNSHFGSVRDADGDVDDARADVRTTNASYYGATSVSRAAVRLDLYPRQIMPMSHPSWAGDTAVIWFIDTDLDAVADWIAVKGADGVALVDSAGATECDVRDISSYDPDFGSYGLEFDPICIGGPSAFAWAGALVVDGDSTRGNSEPSRDEAPDGDGWSHPISAWGGSPPAEAQGYWTISADRQVLPFGRAAQASQTGTALNSPIVGATATSDFRGIWSVAADGGVFATGSATFFGSMGGGHLNQPIVGMAATPGGGGYWLVARDGGIFSFGDAVFHGSTGAIRLNQPIVGMASTPSGDGYWLVASDGGIFAFGDAAFLGSTGAMVLNQPVVGMARNNSGDGYWLVARDGGIFSFGGARFHGSTGGIRLNQPIVGMAKSRAGNGYRFVAADGGVFTFGDATFEGSGAGRASARVVAVATA